MAGTMKPELLDEKRDVNGTTFKEAAKLAGYGGSSHKVSAFIPGLIQDAANVSLLCYLASRSTRTLQILLTC